MKIIIGNYPFEEGVEKEGVEKEGLQLCHCPLSVFKASFISLSKYTTSCISESFSR